MASVLTALRRAITTSGPDVVYECRTCGTSVGPRCEECPTCSSTGIVRYEIR